MRIALAGKNRRHLSLVTDLFHQHSLDHHIIHVDVERNVEELKDDGWITILITSEFMIESGWDVVIGITEEVSEQQLSRYVQKICASFDGSNKKQPELDNV